MNNNLLLFGSYAREDNKDGSDIDLLTLTESKSKKVVLGKINISHYNIELARTMAMDGSLFIYHLKEESKILIDESATLQKVFFDGFRLRNDYYNDINFSWFLLQEIFEKYDSVTNFKYANSKVAWCLRTIFSAIGANERTPLFSRSRIDDFFSIKSSKYLAIKNKDDSQKKLVENIISLTEKIIPSQVIAEKQLGSKFSEFRSKVLERLFDEKSDSFNY